MITTPKASRKVDPLRRALVRARFSQRLAEIRGDGTNLYVVMVVVAVFVLFEGRTSFFKPTLRAAELDDFFSIADAIQPT